jgi:DeoR/GlpR family transcriptional regulator of sugar metabolism
MLETVVYTCYKVTGSESIRIARVVRASKRAAYAAAAAAILAAFSASKAFFSATNLSISLIEYSGNV